ncbi:MAG: MATE family efflux transporter [bacterium]
MPELVEYPATEAFPERRVFPDHKKGGYAEVWYLAYPAVLTMLSQTLMSFVDAVMVGRLGAAQLAGAGLAGTLVWGLFSFFNGLVNGVNTFVAQDFGAKRYENIGKMTWQGIYLAVFSGVVLAAMSIYSAGFFRLLGPGPEVQAVGVPFLRVRLLGGGFMVSWMCFSSFLRGLGDTRTPLKVAVTANIINLFLNWCLIFGKLGFPRLGPTGSALATLIATGFGAGMFLAVFLSKRNAERYATRSAWRLDLGALRRLARVSLPMGVQWTLDMFSFIVFSALIGRISTIGLAASESALRLMSLSFMPVFGVSIASTTLVGQYIGSREINCAVRSGNTALKMGLAYSTFIGLVFMIFPGQLVSLINSDPEVIRTGAQILRLAAIFQFFDGVGIVSSGSLRGAGDTMWTMTVMVSYAWLIFVPLAYVGGFLLHGGAVGAWAGATVYIIGLGITFYLRFRSGRWQRIKI